MVTGNARAWRRRTARSDEPDSAASYPVTFPRAPQNLQQERAGILEVALELNRLGLIWREIPMTDVGIDGRIKEFVDSSGYATGRLVAAQVEGGKYCFNDGDTEWRFYPAARHRFYWERFPLSRPSPSAFAGGWRNLLGGCPAGPA